MEHRVSIVEDLMKDRAPFRDQAVVYLVGPTEESVQRIVQDWTPPAPPRCSEQGHARKPTRGPPYGDTVFLYFLGRLSNALFDKIKRCKELVKRTKVLKEIHLDFLTKEAMAYHLDMGGPRSAFPDMYPTLYLHQRLSSMSSSSSSSIVTTPPTAASANNRQNSSPMHERMITKLVTVCATMNEYPHVRYKAAAAATVKDGTNHGRSSSSYELTKELAFLFQKQMNEFVGLNADWWYHGDGLHPNTERATLLLIDRKEDCLSPLIHEFTYEAMVYDLLPIDDDGRITYDSVNVSADNGGGGGGKEEKKKGGEGEKTTTTITTKKMDALLNDNDELWIELRGKHIADVIQTLSTKIRDIVDSSSVSTIIGKKQGGDGGGALSLNQMANALKALPEYREIMSKLSQHMQIAHQCMDTFNKQGLLELSDLEQTLATGKTDEGRTPKLKELLGRVVEQFRSSTSSGGPNDDSSGMRLRLLAIVVVSQHGISAGDLQKLLGEAHLSREELRTLHNLEKMGCSLTRDHEGTRSNGSSTAEKLMSKVKGEGGGGSSSGRARPYHTGRGGSVSESEYTSSRYVCLLKSIMEDAAQGKLSVEDYPSVLPLPDAESMLAPTSKSISKSVRKTTASVFLKSGMGGGGGPGGISGTITASCSTKKKKAHHGGRQIVFIVGGMCYSELRSAREVMDLTGTEIVIGSTRCISPKDFTNDLHSLG